MWGSLAPAPPPLPAQVLASGPALPLRQHSSTATAAKMSTGVPAGSAASGSNRRLQQTQNQVDEVLLSHAERMDLKSTGEHSGNHCKPTWEHTLQSMSRKCECEVNFDRVIKVAKVGPLLFWKL